MAEDDIALPVLGKHPRKSDKVYDTLLDKIVNGDFPPGDRLVAGDLATKLGVSKTPVREALGRLENRGLVDILPGKGSFVTQLTEKDVTEIYEVREVIEGLAARKVASGADRNEELDELISLGQYLEESFEDQDWDAYNELDAKFHYLLANMSGNKRLSDILQDIRYQSRLLMTRSIKIPGRAKNSILEHKKILEAIKQGKPDLAETRAREHVINVRKALQKASKSLD